MEEEERREYRKQYEEVASRERVHAELKSRGFEVEEVTRPDFAPDEEEMTPSKFLKGKVPGDAMGRSAVFNNPQGGGFQFATSSGMKMVDKVLRNSLKGSAILSAPNSNDPNNRMPVSANEHAFLKSMKDGTARPQDLFRYDTEPLYREEVDTVLREWDQLAGESNQSRPIQSDSAVSEDGLEVSFRTRAEDVRVLTTDQLRHISLKSPSGIAISPPGEAWFGERKSLKVRPDGVDDIFDDLISSDLIDKNGFHFVVGSPHSKSKELNPQVLRDMSEAEGVEMESGYWNNNNFPEGLLLIIQIQPKKFFDHNGEAYVLVLDSDKETRDLIDNLPPLEKRHTLKSASPLRRTSGHGKSRL